MTRYTTTTLALAIDGAHPLAIHDLAHACGEEIDWVIQLVEVGILCGPDSTVSTDHWQFQSADLQCALEARRLERDFGVTLDAAALILDLQHEVRRLKATLHHHGLL